MYIFVPRRIANNAEIKDKIRAIRTCVSVIIFKIKFCIYSCKHIIHQEM